MKQIDIICNDKIYAEMLCLELEAAGYKASSRHSGCADIIIAELGHGIGENCITFSKKEGADLLRPFAVEELISLIEKRTGDMIPHAETDTLYVSPTAKYASYKGTQIALSELEHKLLYYLYTHRDRYVSASELAKGFFDDEGSQNPVRVYISYLRNKLDESFGVKFIYTARGKGYRLMRIHDTPYL